MQNTNAANVPKNTFVFDVSGLSCPYCAVNIENEIKRVDGVAHADLDLTGGQLTVKTHSAEDAQALARRFSVLADAIEPGVSVHMRQAAQPHRLWKNEDIFRIVRVSVGVAIFTIAFLSGLSEQVKTGLWVFVWLLAGYDILWMMLRNLIHGRVFDENFLMSVATIGALAIGEAPEAAAVMLFYQAGIVLESHAVGRSRRSIAALLSIRPEQANVLDEAGQVRVVPADAVTVGSLVLVRPGEKVPLDGTVTLGRSSVLTAALTGEPFPRDVSPDDEVLAGFVNQSGALTVRTDRTSDRSVAARVVEMVENAAASKAKTEAFISRFARVYTPIVTALAVLIAVLPPLLVSGATFSAYINRALIFLVISCPCALVISIPLTFFSGIGGATRKGVLFKSSVALEKMAKADTFVFDKTGTLTEGRFSAEEFLPADGVGRDVLLSRAAFAELRSIHPMARSVIQAYGKEITPAQSYEELPGMGVRAASGQRMVLAGSRAFLTAEGIAVPEGTASDGASVHVAENGRYMGVIILRDTLRDGARRSLSALRSGGAAHIAVLTGDSDASARKTLSGLPVDTLKAGLLPGDKLSALETIMRSSRGGTVFVGDGINDAPALTRADVGLSMGGIGSDAATQAADAVIMTDRLEALPDAVRSARHTMRIVKQNIAFALGFKAIALILGSFGFLSIWLATFADVGVAFLAILNSLRALRVK